MFSNKPKNVLQTPYGNFNLAKGKDIKRVQKMVIDLQRTTDAQCHVTGQCDDFYIGSQYEESHVETDLVVTCSGRTVGDGIRTDFVGITCRCV